MFAFKETLPSGKLSKFIYYTLLCYVASIFFYNAPAITNLLMAAVFILAWLNVAPSSYAGHFSKNSLNLGLVLFFVFQFVSVLFSSDKSSGFDILQMRAPLFVLPLIFCLIDFEQNTWRKILVLYAFFTVAASILGFSYGIYMTINEHNPGYLYNDNISALLLGKQAAYFSLYVNIAIYFILHLLTCKDGHSKYFRAILYFSLGWLVFMNYMLASTMSTISLAIILLAIAFLQMLRKKKLIRGLIVILGLTISVFVLHLAFPKSLVRFQRLTSTSFKFDNTNPENHFDADYNAAEWSSASTRLALWKCGSEIWLAHPIFGTGLGDLRNELKKKYTEKKFWFALNTNRNLHSQYMDILVSMGMAGLLFFLITFLIYPVITFIKRKQALALCVFIGLAFCLFTENMFDRYQGEILIAFVLPLSVKVFDKARETSPY